MKILLIEDVRGLGQKMEVKEVKNGYARHFLFPQKLAVMADRKALANQLAYQQQTNQQKVRYENFVKQLVSERLEFFVKTGEQGEVFESVNQEKIKEALAAKGYQDFEVVLERALKTLGEHQVEIKFPRGIRGTVTLFLQSQS